MKFVDLGKYNFVIEPRYYFYGWSRSGKIVGRKSTAEALVRARKLLPKGYNFKIWDCQRPREVQLKMLESFKKRLKLLHPDASTAELKKLVERFGGPVAVPLKVVRLDTHRNGGSLDLTIVDAHGQELYMGTDHDDLTDKAGTDYFEKHKPANNLELEASKNRRLMNKVMAAAGFHNYAPEWWHWSWDK